MKVIVTFTLFVVSQASVLLNVPAYLNTGKSVQYRNQDSIGNYNFGYNEGHASGGSFRKESGDALGNKIGSYGLRDADGRIRIVNYIADADGFRVDIKTNEPGVEPTNPASTTINKDFTILTDTPAIAVTYVVPPVVQFDPRKQSFVLQGYPL